MIRAKSLARKHGLIVTRHAVLTGTALSGLVILLSAVLGVYADVRSATSLEAAGLLSPDAVVLEGRVGDVVGRLEAARIDARVLVEVDGPKVRAVVDVGRPAPLPVGTGRTFRADDGRVALAGVDAPTTVDASGTWYSVGERRYRVVGTLGLRASSLLADDVVLHDPELLEDDAVVTLIVDGRGAAEALGGDGTTEIAAASRARADARTTADLVSPLVLGLGRTLSLVGAVCAGVAAARSRRVLDTVRRVLGHRRRSIVVAGAVATSTSAAAAGLVIGAVVTLASPPVHALGTTLVTVLVPLCLITATHALTSTLTLRRRP